MSMLSALPRFGLAGALLLAVCGAHTQAQRAKLVDVDLLLVLAVDVSGSVDTQRFELQRDGYVAAFRNAKVLNAIRSGPAQSIAVAMLQWTGPELQVLAVPWTLINSAATADTMAAAIAGAPRQLFGGGTSISGAIDASRALLSDTPFTAKRRIIDVSGDGRNNRGRDVTLARDEAVKAGIGINGLPILALEPDLDDYYKEYVIGGPGAFVVAAKSYETFAEAILKKLISEIASRDTTPSARLVARAAINGPPGGR